MEETASSPEIKVIVDTQLRELQFDATASLYDTLYLRLDEQTIKSLASGEVVLNIDFDTSQSTRLDEVELIKKTITLFPGNNYQSFALIKVLANCTTESSSFTILLSVEGDYKMQEELNKTYIINPTYTGFNLSGTYLVSTTTSRNDMGCYTDYELFLDGSYNIAEITEGVAAGAWDLSTADGFILSGCIIDIGYWEDYLNPGTITVNEDGTINYVGGMPYEWIVEIKSGNWDECTGQLSLNFLSGVNSDYKFEHQATYTRIE
ncbi:hypothetical protein JKA74_13905 [Marivirga sp. S37H4]|uniref:Uncharacterized protein n=1 Tax=Marivirga aurantiaca TaxID=2802615 RepID=A0A934WZZ0_9BACT|nr:hypothetical protein [Marivirga aurantiaca]MBK6266134.1 hypothetical protein [Marivirga aurantiaca]